MIFFLLIFIAYSETIKEELMTKLRNYKGKVIELNDPDSRDIIYSNYSDIFILFYDLESFTSKNLLSNWTKAAEILEKENNHAILATFNIKQSKRVPRKLLLSQYPCAIYFKSGFFYNYTGPFDSTTISNAVIHETYLNTTKYISPKSFSMYEYLLKVCSEGIANHIVFAMNVAIFFIVFIGLIMLGCWEFYKQKMKVD